MKINKRPQIKFTREFRKLASAIFNINKKDDGNGTIDTDEYNSWYMDIGREEKTGTSFESESNPKETLS